jgi:hypothetical protein
MKSKKSATKKDVRNIFFGNSEGDSKDGYNNFSAQLNLSVQEDFATAAITFKIAEGYPEGQFDYKREEVSKGLSLEEAEKLKGKLEVFIKEGKDFLSKYGKK